MRGDTSFHQRFGTAMCEHTGIRRSKLRSDGNCGANDDPRRIRLESAGNQRHWKSSATVPKGGTAFPNDSQAAFRAYERRTKWCFSTRELRVSPYNLQHYVEEDRYALGDYAVLCHSGYGVNSYAIQYYLVYGPLRMFLHLGWGGIYMDADVATSKVRDCFSLADEIVAATASMGDVAAGER